jgi:hypothetical protein
LNFSYLDDGEVIEVFEEIDLMTANYWQYAEDMYDFAGVNVVSMEMAIIVNNMRGDLFIDGLGFIYNDQNFVNDLNCDNIAASWQARNMPSGASFESVYSRNFLYYD